MVPNTPYLNKKTKRIQFNLRKKEMDEIVEKIRAKLAGVDPNEPQKVKGVFQLNIKTGDEVTKTITIDLNKMEVLDDNVDDAADVTVDFDNEAFAQIVQHQITFTDALGSGKATVSGDLALAECLSKVVSCKADDDTE